MRAGWLLLAALLPFFSTSSAEQQQASRSHPGSAAAPVGKHHSSDDAPAPFLVIIHNRTQLHELETLCAHPGVARPARAAAVEQNASSAYAVLTKPPEGEAAAAAVSVLASGEEVGGGGRQRGGNYSTRRNATAAAAAAAHWTARCRKHVGGLCRRVYFHTLRGFAGTFRPSQLQALRRCVPDLVLFVEPDVEVVLHAEPWKRGVARRGGGDIGGDQAEKRGRHHLLLRGDAEEEEDAGTEGQKWGGEGESSGGGGGGGGGGASFLVDDRGSSTADMGGEAATLLLGRLDREKSGEENAAGWETLPPSLAAAAAGARTTDGGDAALLSAALLLVSEIMRKGGDEGVDRRTLDATAHQQSEHRHHHHHHHQQQQLQQRRENLEVAISSGPSAAAAAGSTVLPTVQQKPPISAPLPRPPPARRPLFSPVGVVATAPTTKSAVAPAPWNLDRLDQRALPLDGRYANGGAPPAAAVAAAAGPDSEEPAVNIYILDSGIRATHAEFAITAADRLEAAPGDVDGLATIPRPIRPRTRVMPGYDFVRNILPLVSEDCDGHGTHVAAIAAGKNVGVAPFARLWGVRVLDCSGTSNTSDVIAGIDWVARNAVRPAVVTLSLGIPRGEWSRALEQSVQSLVRVHGLSVAVAAGNSQSNACDIAPSNVPEVLTVGASDLAPRFRFDAHQQRPVSSMAAAGGLDSLYSWGNTGPCVKVFAPGTDIYSACGGSNRCSSVSDTSYTWASGTSMAAPHVAGVAALFLARNPLATPAQVTDAIVRSATVGRINGPTLPGTPNLLLFSGLTPFVAVATAAGGPPGSGGYGGGGGGDVVRSASAEDEGAQHTSTSSSSSSESSSSSDEHTDQSADEDDANLLSHMATSTGNNGGGGGGGGGGGSLHPGSMLWGGWWGSAGSDESQNGSGNSGGAGAGGGGVESSAYPKVSLQVAAAGPASGDGGAPLHSESSRWSWGQSQTVYRTGRLAKGWGDVSWGGRFNFTDRTQSHGARKGVRTIAVALPSGPPGGAVALQTVTRASVPDSCAVSFLILQGPGRNASTGPTNAIAASPASNDGNASTSCQLHLWASVSRVSPGPGSGGGTGDVSAGNATDYASRGPFDYSTVVALAGADRVAGTAAPLPKGSVPATWARMDAPLWKLLSASSAEQDRARRSAYLKRLTISIGVRAEEDGAGSSGGGSGGTSVDDADVDASVQGRASILGGREPPLPCQFFVEEVSLVACF